MKIVYGLLAAGLFIFSIFFFDAYNSSKGVEMLLFPLLMLLCAILIVVSFVRRRITIAGDSLSSVNLLSKREMPFTDIKGYRIGRKEIRIESISAANSTMVIRNYIDFGDSADLVSWIKGSFADLDGTDYEAEKNNIAHDLNLGFTAEERQQKLARAKTVALLYNVIGVFVGIALFLPDQPIITIVAIIYPLLGILIIMTSNGLIKFTSNIKQSVLPFVVIGFVVPAMVLLGKGAGGHHLLNTDNLWLPALGFALVILVLLLRTGLNKTMGNLTGQTAILAIVCLIYAFASIVEINCEFDQSPVKVYHATVLGHHISHGKNTSYYLYLTAWGPCTKQEQVSVGSKTYNNTNVGDTVTLNYKPGLLNISWFFLAKQ
ncbi:hypothetical protein [Mucilaginibacter sp. UR6-11]|uniref:hypothetical protein n=1 Tax=Mucilaginibacter sp. UR6-11 TaxID=1435644 RepID=UPI001E303309|nr:hypothetical protein [Mucilaginibacter sp. UR6-11]MCC8427327.1 hypothetical protein [Mucilaginibacter sp. UR6-11]